MKIRGKALCMPARGELEITHVTLPYLGRHDLHVEILGRGIAWFDAGTQQSLSDASQLVRIIEERQGLKIPCLEEVAYRMGFIDARAMLARAQRFEHSDYGDYLMHILLEDGYSR
jgi:glucose-1-phosphate thymidylyltransferase